MEEISKLREYVEFLRAQESKYSDCARNAIMSGATVRHDAAERSTAVSDSYRIAREKLETSFPELKR